MDQTWKLQFAAAGIQAIGFDLDGTLLDSDPAEEDAFVKMWEFVTGNPCPDAALATYLEELEAISRAWDEGLVSANELGGPAIRRAAVKAGLHADPAQLPALEEIYLQVAASHGHLFPEVPLCLERLLGTLPLAILTNGPAELQRRKVEGAGLNRWVDVIHISGQTGVAKPDIAAFERLAAEVGCAPNRMAFLGDSAGSDILGASKAAMRTVWINRHGDPYPRRLPTPWAVAADVQTALEALAHPNS